MIRNTTAGKKQSYNILIGECIVTRERDITLTTVLGPCIAVCLIDESRGIVGMNHFMMPGQSRYHDTRYGLDCTQALIDKMIQAGADPKRLRAKVFGGATILKRGSDVNANVPFIMAYLKMRRIPVQKTDTGGRAGRKVSICTTTYSAEVRKFIPQITMRSSSPLLTTATT